MGYNFSHKNARYVVEAGLGIHLPLGEYIRINTEITTAVLADFKGNKYFKSSFRILAGLKLGDRIEFFAGPGINYMNYDFDQNDIRSDHYIWHEKKGNQYNGLFVGGVAGIQFRL
jgi:hypothetical protein